MSDKEDRRISKSAECSRRGCFQFDYFHIRKENFCGATNKKTGDAQVEEQKEIGKEKSRGSL